MRVSARLANAAAAATTKPALSYALGISYAAKQSPPFVHRNGPAGSQGFAGQPTKLGKWVDGMKALPAGRGELRPTEGEEGDGGWAVGLGERVRKWGAGEDFFGIVDGGAFTHIALSDGVGGWAPHYDPALYSQALMFHYAQALMAAPSLAPWDALDKAYAAVAKDDAVPAGSATAVGMSLGEDGKGRAVNLGDSGFTILRKGQSVFETQSQTHFFNCPYQLSKIPEKMKRGEAIEDTPSRGERMEFDLQAGDVVVLYSDGLSDNLPAAHIPHLNTAILSLLSSEPNAHLSRDERTAEHARLLADVLVAAGRAAMTRTGKEDGGKGWKTPFEIEAAKHKERYEGGKIDDITVLTAVVSERLG